MSTAAAEKESHTDELEEGAEIPGQEEGQQQQEEKGGKKPDDNAEMRQALTDLAGTVRELATPKKEEEKLTPEQIDDLWAVYKPTKTKADFMKKFFRMNEDATPEEVKAAEDLFYDMRDGITRQAVTGARHFTAIELDKLAKKFQPILDYVEERKTTDLRERFFKTYESLADPKYKKIIDAQAKILKASGKEFPDENAYFKALAEGAAETIRDVIPEFDLGKKPEKKPAATTPRIPRTTVGGGSSAGGGGGSTESSDNEIDELD
jgi:hypothetical protein